MDKPKIRIPLRDNPLDEARRLASQIEQKKPWILFEKAEKEPVAVASQGSSRFHPKYKKLNLLKYGEPALKPGCEFDTRKRPVRYLDKNGPHHTWDMHRVVKSSECDCQKEDEVSLLDLSDPAPSRSKDDDSSKQNVPLVEEKPKGPQFHHPQCVDLLCPGGKACQPDGSHHSLCNSLMCKGGKQCHDRYDPAKIAAASDFVKEMAFCKKSEEVVCALVDVPYSMENIRKERLLTTQLFCTLQSRGALSLEDLWKELPYVADEFGSRNYFENKSIDFLRDFLETRNFVFERPPHARLYRNRGHGYKLGIQEIVSFIRDRSFYQYGCKVLDVWNKVVIKRLHPYDPREHGPGIRVTDGHFTLEQMTYASELVELLETEHPHLFEFTDKEDIHKAYVRLTPEAFTYPSLWWPRALPTRPIRDEEDRSRTFQMLVRVFDDVPMGEMAYVLHGPFHLRIVSLSWVELKEANPVFFKGDILNVVAFINFNGEYDFTVVKYSNLDNYEEPRFRRSLFSFAHPLFGSYGISTQKLPPPLPEVPVLSEDKRRKLLWCVKSEKAKIEVIDKILDGGFLSFDEFKTQYEKAEQQAGLGSSESALNFIRARPYLYTVDEENQYVQEMFFKDRVSHKYFLSMLSYFPNGLTRLELIYRLKVGQAGRNLQDAAFSDHTYQFLNKLSIVISLDEAPGRRDMDNDVIAIKGTYVSDARVVLPYYAMENVHRVDDVLSLQEEASAATNPEKAD